jgi:hypothetical protein
MNVSDGRRVGAGRKSLPFYDVLNQSLVNMPAKKTIDRGK